MNHLSESELQSEVDQLLKSIEEKEVPIYELGTPEILETKETISLINLGPRIIPYLLMMSEKSSSKIVAYIVYILGRLGYKEVIPHLLKLRERFQKLETKTGWDYAVIGQCNLAIEELS